MSEENKCPVPHGAHIAGGGTTNQDWWPNQLKLDILHQHSAKSNPMGKEFDYAKEFKRLNLKAVKKDLQELMTKSAGHQSCDRLRPLWTTVDPHGMAQRRNIPYR
jgi:catalase-peroxidase